MTKQDDSGAAEEAFWQQQHERLRTMPEAWTLEADSMTRSFELLAAQAEADRAEYAKQNAAMRDWHLADDGSPQPRLVQIVDVEANALMLGALAVEIHMKAVAIQVPDVLKAIGAGDRDIRLKVFSHELGEIATVAGIALTEQEAYLCTRLEAFLRWAGRYPVANSYKAMMPQATPDGGRAPHSISFSSDFTVLRTLIRRLREKLPKFDYNEVTVLR